MVRPNPTILEINTWPWLTGLSSQFGRAVSLATVPDAIWDDIGSRGFDAVWLMGVWQRSPVGVAIGLDEPPLVDTFRETLPDYTDDDVVGSAYCIRDYVVDDHLGGPTALKVARAELAARGMDLILDWVPNHVAVDHPWASAHPDRFIRGDRADLERARHEFVEVGDQVIANGRDPYFAPWRDVLQLNIFDDGLRRAAIATLLSVADQCDGIRCDMAMLMLGDIFARTWQGRVGEAPEVEYWEAVIGEIRAAHPSFMFIAEAYWGTENRLLEQGFDFCYDKELYDAIAHDPAAVADRLDEDPSAAQRSVRFIENHDEPRAQDVFGDRHRCAAVTVLTQPGARLVYDGQSVGRRIRTPVQLGRDPVEPPDVALDDFYRRLLNCLGDNAFHEGQWRRLMVSGWPGYPCGPGLLAWQWTLDGERWLIVVNLDDREGAGLVTTDWHAAAGGEVTLVDPVEDVRYERAGDDVASELFVRLQPWGFHVFHVQCERSGDGP